MKARNSRSGRELSADVEVADSAFKRMKGLLGRNKLDVGCSLWIRPSRGIHTIGMRFPIDVVFLDKRNVVLKIRENVPPNRITGLYFNVVSVLELPAGTLTATDTRVGDTVEIA